MARVRIRDEKDLEKWLNGLPEEQCRRAAVAIAARAAMRALPALEAWLKRNEDGAISIVLPTFRAQASSWLVAVGPSRDADVIKAALATIANTAATTTANAYAADTRAANAVLAAALTANVNFNDITPTTAAEASTKTVSHSANAAALTAEAAYAYAYAYTFVNASATLKAVEADVDAIANGTSIPELMNTPLWPIGTSQWAQKLWRSMKARLLARRGEHWEVWTNWYDARLDPSRPIPCYNPPDKNLERARVLLPKELWEKGPAAVNEEIKRLIDESGCGGQVMETLAKTASPEPYLDAERKLDVRPNAEYDRPKVDEELLELPIIQSALIRQILAELNEERNAPQIVKASFKAYLDELAGRGIQPILGILDQSEAVIRAATRGDDADWLTSGAKRALEIFFENHEKIMRHFPLDEKRQEIYKQVPVNEEELFGTLHQHVSDFLMAVTIAYKEGELTTEDYFTAVGKMEELAKTLSSSPEMIQSADGGVSPLKRLFNQFAGFVKKTMDVVKSLNYAEKSEFLKMLLEKGREILDALKDFLN